MLSEEEVKFFNHFTGKLEKWCRKRDVAIVENTRKIKELNERIRIRNRYEILMYLAFTMLGISVLSFIIGYFFQ